MSTIDIDRNEYQKEQNELLKTILNYRFFNPWKNIGEYSDQRALWADSNLELYITNKCNQKCEYCYLQKHSELYPEKYNTPEVILHNLELLYQYLINNDYSIPRLDLFSGEIWHTQFGQDILQLTYKYTLLGLKYNSIIISSNGSFVNTPQTFHIIQDYINKFKDLGRQLLFSISIDGKIIDNISRERIDNSNIYTDDFYDNVFSFAKYNNFYFHPMVSANNIHLWHDNYIWWKEKFNEYNMNINDLMMLEVRDNNWTDETIMQYCNFILELAEDVLQNTFNNNIQLLGDTFISKPTSHYFALSGYYPWLLTGKMDNFLGCTVPSHLCIRLGDLAICPCHRTAYDRYLYGKFVVKNDKITDIMSINPQMAIKVLMGNTLTSMHKCDVCLYKQVCIKGCLGAQIEAVDDPFFPCPSVCKLFEAKYSTLIQYYKNKGLFNYYGSLSPEQEGAQEALNLLKLYNKWEELHNGMGEKK